MHKEDSREEVIRRNSDLVYRLAFSLVKSGADADDIYQDVFMQYIKRRPVFESHEHEKAWFVRVTVNRCRIIGNRRGSGAGQRIGRRPYHVMQGSVQKTVPYWIHPLWQPLGRTWRQRRTGS